MSIIQKMTFLILLILIFIAYLLLSNTNAKEPIKIEPIKVAPIVIKESNSKKNEYNDESPDNILLKLKIASELSQENILPSKEKEEQNVVSNLKKTIAQQEKVQTKEKEKVYTKQKVSTPKPIVNKQVVLKVNPKNTEHKPKILKKDVVSKKVIPKKEVELTKNLPVLPKEEAQPVLEEIIAIKEDTSKREPKKANSLSREEEVALYKSTYENSLEVVNVSENFEIEEDTHLPDSHYFEPIQEVQSSNNNAPLEFVEKLGVVSVSDQYETEFNIPEKVELAQEGIVNISSASIETQELKNLEFVDTLGVVEVSKDFETTQANHYLNQD